MAKVSFSVPDSILDDLNYVSSRMGITRSALVSELLGASTPQMRELFETIPEGLNPGDLDETEVRRLRGNSKVLIRKQMEDLKGIDNDLLSDL